MRVILDIEPVMSGDGETVNFAITADIQGAYGWEVVDGFLHASHALSQMAASFKQNGVPETGTETNLGTLSTTKQ